MPELFQFALLSFSAVFVIVDPLGIVPLFLALTPNDTPQSRREMARRACLVAWSVLIAFAFLGTRILSVFGITLAAFKVAGGLLMLVTAFDQLRAQHASTRTTDAEQHEGAAKADVSVVPLAMPLLAGPGAIATVTVLMSRAHAMWQDSLVIAAITLTIAIAYVALRFSDRIARLLGTTGRLVGERLIGLVLAAIAIQFVLDGVQEALHH